MNIIERILLSLSRAPETKDYGAAVVEWTTDDSLSLLEKEYPLFGTLISGKRVVDFGCGMGFQSIALAQKYNCFVVGIESNLSTLQCARQNAEALNVFGPKLVFVDKISDNMLHYFDFVISQNSFEHFDDPSLILDEMRKLLNESGQILLTFGPPWFAPYGSHMHFFCKVPWINVLFSEKTVMNVRNHFRSDGAKRYEQVESGLNKMTIAKFERIIKQSNLKIESKSYKCVKGIDVLSKIPFLREFFINSVSVVLSKV